MPGSMEIFHYRLFVGYSIFRILSEHDGTVQEHDHL